MDSIRVFLFGALRVERMRAPGVREPVRIPHKIQALLAWLLVHPPQPHPRERIAEDLWGNQGAQRAQLCLNTALYRLRQILEPDGVCPRGFWIVASADDLGLNWESPLWLDAAEVERTAARALAQPAAGLNSADAEALEAALALCTADLLDGFYDDWALHRREAVRHTHLNSLALLMQYHQHGRRLHKSAQFARRLLEQDPLREEVHRTLMRLYAGMGQVPDALRQYDLCTQVLARDLGVPPMPETQELHRRIVTGEPLVDDADLPAERVPLSLTPAPLLAGIVSRLADELRSTLQTCDDTRRRVQAILDTIEHLPIDRQS